MMETKRCSKCQEKKPLSDFRKNASKKDGKAGEPASKLLEERNEARAEAQRLRGLLWDAADRFRQIRDEPTSNAASDWDIVREMEATAKDALVELNTEGDLDPEPKSGEVL